MRSREDFAAVRFVLDERYEDGHSAIEARLDRTARRYRPQGAHGAQPQRSDPGRDAPVAQGEARRAGRRCAARSRARLPRPRRPRSVADAGLHAPAARRGVVDGAVVRRVRRSVHRRRDARARCAAPGSTPIRSAPPPATASTCRSIASTRPRRSASRALQVNAGLRAAVARQVRDRRRSTRSAPRCSTCAAWPGTCRCSPPPNSASCGCRREYTTGSSIMPNKRNPDVVELMRASYASVAAARTRDRAAAVAAVGLSARPAIQQGRDRARLRPRTRRAGAAAGSAGAHRVECASACAPRSSRRCMRPTLRSKRPPRGVPFREAYRRAAEARAAAGEGRTPEAVSPRAFRRARRPICA